MKLKLILKSAFTLFIFLNFSLFSQLVFAKKNQTQTTNEQFVNGLTQALNQMYLAKYPNANLTEVNQESSRIALGLSIEIPRLKKSYRIVGFPILHNMMISIGVRKRGVCHDWAEDLLKFLRPIPRKHFWVTWGEAFPGKLHEHNVAVIYPSEGSFYDGIMIDPWRTGGKPFWLKVTADKKYKWNPWEYYGVY